MRIKKIDVLVVGLSVLSLIGLALAIYPRLPETIPVHWNYKSQVDGWGPRWTLLIMGALPLAIYLLMKGLPHIDPRKEAYKKHEKPYMIISALIALFVAPIAWIMGLADMGLAIDVGIIDTGRGNSTTKASATAN